jgi:hypothetical protein
LIPDDRQSPEVLFAPQVEAECGGYRWSTGFRGISKVAGAYLPGHHGNLPENKAETIWRKAYEGAGFDGLLDPG